MNYIATGPAPKSLVLIPKENPPRKQYNIVSGALHHRPQPGGGLLTALTMDKLRRFFATTKHRPAEAGFAALQALIATFEAMAEGQADPVFFLSSLDPGMGKTTAAVKFVDVLLSRPEHDGTGVLMCVSRLEEIKGLVHEMGLPEGWFGVFTSDPEVNALGVSAASFNDAQVLFATHAMVESRCRDRSFGDVAALHYRGRPRAVRIWDESILPGREVTLSADDIAALPRVLRYPFPRLTAQIDTLHTAVKAAADGERITVPDFLSDCGVTESEVLSAFNDQSAEDVRRTAFALCCLSGKLVTVRQDGKYGNTALDYREVLPADLAPLVITDASGRVRETYAKWREGRGNIRLITTAPKSYRNLRVHLWRRGGGKSSFFGKDGDRLVSGIATTINAKPFDPWLIIHHKPRGGIDIEKSVRSLLKVADQSKVHFLTYGRHTSTNDYKEVPNVILAGTQFLRPSTVEGIARAALGRTSKAGNVSREDLKAVEVGESRHLILQAACRGAIRNNDGDACAPGDLYVIAANGTGIPDALPTIFPEARMLRWRPEGAKAVKGKVAEAIACMAEWLAWQQVRGQHVGDFLPFKVVQAAIGVKDAGNFTRTIRQHPDFQDWCEDYWIEEVSKTGTGKYNTGWRVFDPEKVFADETPPEAQYQDDL